MAQSSLLSQDDDDDDPATPLEEAAAAAAAAKLFFLLILTLKATISPLKWGAENGRGPGDVTTGAGAEGGGWLFISTHPPSSDATACTILPSAL